MATSQLRPLPKELADVQVEMEEHARRYGLDFFPTIFEVVDVDQLNAIAAYGGFPTRYPHWRFGMEYERLAKGYAYGLQKIYELVINNDPCYAYLLGSNSITDHKMVIAHVYGHCDFFKNNYWFSQTNRKMIDEMANHGNRIRRYMDRFGVEEVEDVHRRLPERRRSDRHSLAVHQAPGGQPIATNSLPTSTMKVSPKLPADSRPKDTWIRTSIRRTCCKQDAKRNRAPTRPPPNGFPPSRHAT